VEAYLLDVRADRPEHPSGDDDDVDARVVRGLDRGARPWRQDAVLADERPVEVDRERRQRAREAGGKVYGSFPPVDFTT